MNAAQDPSAQRSGLRTSELWGKVVVQLVLVLNALFDLGIEIDDEVALGIVGLLESTYAISRSLAKRTPAAASTDQLVAAVAAALAAHAQAPKSPQPPTP